MNTTYEYIDEASINPELICSICQSPFIDPQHTPCDDTFCRECITNWIQRQNASCPLCRKPLSINVLKQATRTVRNMLNQLPVKCTSCGQTELQRGNFNDHIQKVCPKTVVSCSAADIKCPWRGQRDQLNQHLIDCRFEAMRPVITQFVTENQQLTDQVNRQMTQIIEQQNEIKELKEQVDQQRTQICEHQNENQQLKEQVAQLRTQVNTPQRETQQFNKQLRQKDTQITSASNQSRE
jgi:vacuolar-type H+-ATPase subunit I/STV1